MIIRLDVPQDQIHRTGLLVAREYEWLKARAVGLWCAWAPSPPNGDPAIWVKRTKGGVTVRVEGAKSQRRQTESPVNGLNNNIFPTNGEGGSSLTSAAGSDE